MKKLLFGLIICALGYYGYVFYQKRQADTGSQQTAESTPASTTPATPTPVIVTKRVAPAGTFYTLQKMSITNDEGVIGISPGTQVTLVKDNGDTKLVSDGKNQFEVTPAQITDDLDVAAQIRGVEIQSQAAAAMAASAPPPVAGGSPPALNAQALYEKQQNLKVQIAGLAQQSQALESQMTATQEAIDKQNKLNAQGKGGPNGKNDVDKDLQDLKTLKAQDDALKAQIAGLQSQLSPTQ